MMEAQGVDDGSEKSTEPPAQSDNNDSHDCENGVQEAEEVSQRNQAIIPILLYLLSIIAIGTCIGMIAWLALHGPALVPEQDTRITAIIISIGSRLAGLFMATALVRSAWAAFLPQVLAGKPITTRTLIGVCQNFMSWGQLQYYSSLPSSFKYHVILAVLITLLMTATSASFRYESLGSAGPNVAIVPDVSSICNQSLIDGTNYWCSTALNGQVSAASWSYIQEVDNGGQGTVYQYGKQGDQELGANVTLSILPPGWTLEEGNDLPWMGIWVTCRHLSISTEFTGSYFSALSTISVNDTVIDILDIANMPDWGSVIHLYQQANDTGPRSNLSPFIVVMLARDPGDGTANLKGLAPDAVTHLGQSYLDLHGKGPTMQGVLGAAAWCEFDGSVGGQWPDDVWPPLNHTSNVVIGPVIDDHPTLGTTLLNYGPSWQYSPISGNSLPGGSVSYIANVTEAGTSFPALFSLYIRNQWTLMAYSIARQSSQQTSLPFVGSGPKELYITLTIVSVLPFSALVIGLLLSLRALFCTILQRHYVNRIEFENWWLVKALCPEMYEKGYRNATEEDFSNACKDYSVNYIDEMPDSRVGLLVPCTLRPNEIRRSFTSTYASRVHG